MSTVDKMMARDPDLTQPEPEKVSEMVSEIDRILSLKTQDQKSNLISMNIKGINRAESMQNYLENYYGFRIGVLDALVDKKISIVKSREGWGVGKALEGLKTLQSHIETNIGGAATPLDTLVGKR